MEKIFKSFERLGNFETLRNFEEIFDLSFY